MEYLGPLQGNLKWSSEDKKWSTTWWPVLIHFKHRFHKGFCFLKKMNVYISGVILLIACVFCWFTMLVVWKARICLKCVKPQGWCIIHSARFYFHTSDNKYFWSHATKNTRKKKTALVLTLRWLFNKQGSNALADECLHHY